MKVMENNDVPKTTGIINISHHVNCPHCKQAIFDDFEKEDREWWNNNITDQLPDNDAYKEQYDVNCRFCGKRMVLAPSEIVYICLKCGSWEYSSS